MLYFLADAIDLARSKHYSITASTNLSLKSSSSASVDISLYEGYQKIFIRKLSLVALLMQSREKFLALKITKNVDHAI